ncbi:hypothetical protein SNEBB_009979 [Seison nebaliae]|nr:hypothetical protein SNEBB_009979 [Seison nebaliae]
MERKLSFVNLVKNSSLNSSVQFRRPLTSDNGMRSDQNRRRCPKCGGLCSAFPILIKPSKIVICQNCGHIFDEMKLSTSGTNSTECFDRTITPKQIHTYLDDYIIGQSYAKKVISVAVYNHYKRIGHNLQQQYLDRLKIMEKLSSYNFASDLNNTNSLLPLNTFPKNEDNKKNNNINNNELDSVIGWVLDQKQLIPSSPVTTITTINQKDEKSQNKNGLFFRRLNSLHNSTKMSSDDKLGDPTNPSSLSTPIKATTLGNIEKNLKSNILKNNNLLVEYDDKKHTRKSIIDKSNILMLGPSGTGKTLLARTIARYLNVPFAICDCTTLTQAGYVGENIESIVVKLFQNSNYNVERCQEGIIFLDEVDKIAASNAGRHSRDVGGEGVQQSLLKLMEGSIVTVPESRNGGGFTRKLHGESVQVDTTNILFVVSGAFVGMDSIISQRQNTKLIGFNLLSPSSSCNGNKEPKSNVEEQREKKDGEFKTDDAEYRQILEEQKYSDKLLDDVEAKDLISYGMIPEFVGRIPIIVNFHSLDEHMLKRILVEPNNSVVSQFKELFDLDRIELKLTDDALIAIARQAKMKRTGARGLRSILERVLLDAMYECPEDKDIRTVRVTRSSVLNKGAVELLKHERCTRKTTTKKTDVDEKTDRP